MTPIQEQVKRRLTAAERRERILDAAVEVFAERGYTGASMGEIAARADVVASVIYDHFSSKRELHIELLERHGNALIERTIVGMGDVPPDRLVGVSVEAFYRFVEEDPFVWRFLFRDPPGDPEIAAAWRRMHGRATEEIAALIRSAVPEAETLFGVPAERASQMLARAGQETVEGLAEWWWEHREVPREDIVRIATGMLWEGFETLLAREGGRSAGASKSQVQPASSC
jgi:AcrR family transcriptional regulator